MAVLSYMVQNQYTWVSKAHTCHTMFKRTFKLEMYRLRGHRRVGHAPKCKCIYFVYFMTSCNEFSARKPLEHLTVCLWVHLVLELQNSQYIFWVCQECSTQPRKRKKLVCYVDADTLRNTLKSSPIWMKFHLDSHSCMHPVSHPTYATDITNPQNYHVVVFMEWQVKYN